MRMVSNIGAVNILGRQLMNIGNISWQYYFNSNPQTYKNMIGSTEKLIFFDISNLSLFHEH